MIVHPSWTRVSKLLEDLYAASEELESLFPGRKFSLDGHLVGSVGEVIAAFMFDLELNPASTQGHDALSKDGRNVEIKLTQGRSVAIRHEPEHLIVLHRPKGGPLTVAFNGNGSVAWNAAGTMKRNGQRAITLSKLAELGGDCALPQIRPAPV